MTALEVTFTEGGADLEAAGKRDSFAAPRRILVPEGLC